MRRVALGRWFLGALVGAALLLSACLPSIPPPVTGLSASVTSSSVSLSWTNPPDSFWGVRVYRAEGSTPPVGPAQGAPPGAYLADVGDGASYVDGGLPAGATYSYSVIVYGADGYYSSPATVSATAPIPAADIAAGDLHTCGRPGNGTVRCWGAGNNGQLGNGGLVESLTPVTVSGITTATQVTAGNVHTCAPLDDGTVRCWGSGTYGQLGNGSTSLASSPVAVTGISTATQVSAGGYHTCAVLIDGTVRCWGRNNHGQLGNGTTTTAPTSSPVTVAGISTATQVHAGDFHTCALLADTTVRCWGLNSSGQLGNGSTTTSSTPVTVAGLSTATQIATGYFHSCARLADGTARCWGNNLYGQLGNGTSGSPSSTPVTVSGIATATQLTAGGDYHSCAVLSDGTARCWGVGTWGQLGDGTYASSTTPVTVSGIGTATQIAAAYRHSCALLADGTIRCWGYNVSGQLGDGTHDGSPVPVAVGGFP